MNFLQKLEKIASEGSSIRTAVIGVGQMGKGLCANLGRVAGININAIATKYIDSTIDFIIEHKIKELKDIVVFNSFGNPEKSFYKSLGHVNLTSETTPEEIARKVNNPDFQNKLIVTDNSDIIPLIDYLEVVVDATGKPEVGAKLALQSILHKKHVVTLNVEGDVTIGPILKKMSEEHGVVYTVSAGDEPAATKELFDFAKLLNLNVIAAGKGKNNPLDRYANPKSLKEFADEKGSNPYMMTSFIDGTKSMIEMACLSNATGLVPDIRGMHGPRANINELTKILIPRKDGGILEKTGVVDFVIGDLAPGVFLVYSTDSEIVRRDLEYLKNGSGPYFLLYRPYHLASIETPVSIAGAVLYNEPTIQPMGSLISEVMTFAKKDLAPGEVLDGIGGFATYGLIELHSNVMQNNYLPIGLSEGCILKKKISKDEPIKFEDVDIPENSVLFELRRKQDREIG